MRLRFRAASSGSSLLRGRPLRTAPRRGSPRLTVAWPSRMRVLTTLRSELDAIEAVILGHCAAHYPDPPTYRPEEIKALLKPHGWLVEARVPMLSAAIEQSEAVRAPNDRYDLVKFFPVPESLREHEGDRMGIGMRSGGGESRTTSSSAGASREAKSRAACSFNPIRPRCATATSTFGSLRRRSSRTSDRLPRSGRPWLQTARAGGQAATRASAQSM
jgi:hypothetical protein